MGNRTVNLLAIFTLVLITLIFYAPLGMFQFVNWDDASHVFNNPSIRSLNWDSVRAWFEKPVAGLYIPIPVFSYAVEYALFRNLPEGYHLTNLLIHVLNSLLVMGLLFSFFENRWFSFLGALLFSIHPAQVESVAWISQRGNLLFTLFSLLGMHVWIRGREIQNRVRFWMLISLFFILAVCCRITAVVIPLIYACHRYFYGDRSPSGKWIYFLLGILMSVLMGWMAIILHPEALSFFRTHPPAQILSRQIAALYAYLEHFFFPVDIRALYPEPRLADFWAVPLKGLLLTLLAAGMLFALVFAVARKKQYGFWLSWLLILLLPVILLPVPVKNSHLYLAMLGAVAVLLALFQRSQAMGIVIFLTANLMCFSLAKDVLASWRDSGTLWERVLSFEPDNQTALLHQANHYKAMGKINKAIGLYERLIETSPEFPIGYLNLCNTYLAIIQADKAEEVANRFEAVSPGHPDLSFMRAAIAYQRGNYNQAYRHLIRATEQNTKNPYVYLNLGLIHFRSGEFKQAVPYFIQAVSMSEHFIQAYYFLGVSYIALKQYPAAVKIFSDMEKKGMLHAGMYAQQGYALFNMGERDRAEEAFLKSTRIHPQVSEAHYHLARMRYETRQYNQAKAYIEKALEISPSLNSYQNLLEKINAAMNAAGTDVFQPSDSPEDQD